MFGTKSSISAQHVAYPGQLQEFCRKITICSNHCDINWPSRPFFLWAFLRIHVYINKSAKLENLKTVISYSRDNRRNFRKSHYQESYQENYLYESTYAECPEAIIIFHIYLFILNILLLKIYIIRSMIFFFFPFLATMTPFPMFFFLK